MAGKITVITGCMMSGKTIELVRELTIAKEAGLNVLAFKSQLDTRYDKKNIVSHSGISFPAISVSEPKELLFFVKPNTDVIGIDEIQFFDDSMIRILEHLADRGIQIIVAGLDKDFRGEPFGIMPDLLAEAEEVKKIAGICSKCGEPAAFSQRLIAGVPAGYYDDTVVIDNKDKYEPRCRKHFIRPLAIRDDKDNK